VELIVGLIACFADIESTNDEQRCTSKELPESLEDRSSINLGPSLIRGVGEVEK